MSKKSFSVKTEEKEQESMIQIVRYSLSCTGSILFIACSLLELYQFAESAPGWHGSVSYNIQSSGIYCFAFLLMLFIELRTNRALSKPNIARKIRFILLLLGIVVDLVMLIVSIFKGSSDSVFYSCLRIITLFCLFLSGVFYIFKPQFSSLFKTLNDNEEGKK